MAVYSSLCGNASNEHTYESSEWINQEGFWVSTNTAAQNHSVEADKSMNHQATQQKENRADSMSETDRHNDASQTEMVNCPS